MKRTNKGAQPEISGQPPAEFVEKRPPAEGNRVQAAVTGTQGPEAALIGLNRVREAAKRDKPGIRITYQGGSADYSGSCKPAGFSDRAAQ